MQKQAANWTEIAKHDGAIADMLRLGIPITRENYIKLNHFTGVPAKWTAEHEEELPEPLQDWSKVRRR